MDFYDEIVKFNILLDKEIKKVRHDDKTDYLLTNGEFLRQDGDYFLYRFNTEYEIKLNDSFPINLKVKGNYYPGRIIDIEKEKILISLRFLIKEPIDKVFLLCNPAFLLEGLQERLKELSFNPKGLGKYIIENGKKEGTNSKLFTKDDLQKMLDNEKVLFIWGPPGSGKTTTVGKIVQQYVNKGKRILILSQSNTAVDEAIEKVISLYDNSDFLSQGKIIRYGYVQQDILKENKDYCDVYRFVLNQHLDLKQKLIELDKQIKEADNLDINVNELKDRKDEIRDILFAERKNILHECFVLGTTVSKAIIDDIIYNQMYDVVIFDEASMAYVPQIIFAASLATSQFICVGDMKQLSPISHENELQEDIYTYLNMENLDGSISHSWLVLLDKQYRSHPLISRFVNRNYYLNKMKNGIDEHDEYISNIVNSQPFFSLPLVLLNTEGFFASSCITLEHSRINIVHACIAVILATEAYKKTKKKIGIITPYAAQARLIRKMLIDDLGKRNYDITCATVHQFQGDEKDIIIFDTVENYPNEKLGVLTSNNSNHAVDRLINVALTRAKGKFIMIGNYSYWKKYANSTNAFLKLMNYINGLGDSTVINGNDLKYYIEKSRFGKIKFWDDDDDAAYSFVQNLDEAENYISVMLTRGNQINKTCLNELKKITMDKDRTISLEIKTPIQIPELNAFGEVIEITKRDSLPISIIDGKTVWFGIPDMNRYYDLKKDSHIYEYNKLMIRINGKHTANVLDDLLDFRHDLEIVNREENAKNLKQFVESKNCSNCDNKLKLIKENNKMYIFCPHCRDKNLLNPIIINQFFLEKNITCPNDGGKLTTYVGPYGLVIKCSERHKIDFYDFFEF